MKSIYLTLIIFCFLSCTKNKSVLLPEINHSKITEILDVSPAYIFYDNTKPDSLELNRKNLIITTNWLVNIDKRLTLKQVLPSIVLLQNKKRNAEMHKNEDAKNYFTCNNTSIKNLGFIEFTDVIYQTEQLALDYKNDSSNSNQTIITYSHGTVKIDKLVVGYSDVITTLNSLVKNKINLILNFDKALKFQDYISAKEKLQELKNPNITINNNEFIY